MKEEFQFYEKTPLSIAIESKKKGNELMVKYLIEHGANVNVQLKIYNNEKSFEIKTF